MESIDLSQLDPGVRSIVEHIRWAGFETTDSGDGRSKEPSAEVLPFGHVAIASSPVGLLSDANAVLLYLRTSRNIPAGFTVEATYWPIGGEAVILVSWPGPL